MYTKDDLKEFKRRDIKRNKIDEQLQHFKENFEHISLESAATLNQGIRQITEEEMPYLTSLYEEASQKAEVVKMVPASGSATRMFKELYHFQDNYKGTEEDYLQLIQQKDYNQMNGFFLHMEDFPFYERLQSIIWEDGKDLKKMLNKRQYPEIIEYILSKKNGLQYGNTPKALVDFHIYRDFVRTAFDEHLVEAALYCKKGKEAKLHFTVSEEYLTDVQARLKKVEKVFEKMFNVKYNVTFSVQKPSTDTVSVDKKGNLVRDDKGKILFRPGGHGALIHNLNDIKADVVFIKNIDNVVPDRSKAATVKYKKLLGGLLFEMQSKIFERLDLLEKRHISDEQLDEIEDFVQTIGYKKPENIHFATKKERVKFLRNVLNRPIRICGMVKNEGEPGGGPFWVKTKDGSCRLMIIEAAQVNMKDKGQKKIFESSEYFNPVDIVCGTRDHSGKKFDLTRFIDPNQGFISTKTYKGKEILAQELPGLWNGAMSEWISIFVEVPLSTFTPVKSVFDLRRTTHRNVLFKN